MESMVGSVKFPFGIIVRGLHDLSRQCINRKFCNYQTMLAASAKCATCPSDLRTMLCGRCAMPETPVYGQRAYDL